ncbi:Gfo/Idh/MocA family protein [Alteribacter aurantiacus]|uniref:Gfo/Idh/MocA family protein n=1 Tax=Alteribacter aurantiacus TaxID=254410 RepID=UPI00040ABC29|nr:Gfo/Idh/MocA family oxidoreductase [Alteribacter aurantiacus]
MSKRIIRFGIIGCGLMGKEFASAASRWCHLIDLDFVPRIVAVCDPNPAAVTWFSENVDTVETSYSDYKELLKDDTVEAIYCAVPHHLHGEIYVDIIKSRKHLLGEKPFGVDYETNIKIKEALNSNPDLIVRCSSEFPFFPGAYQIYQWVKDKRFGKIIDVEVGFWHSSDLDPNKHINWKRQIDTNGEYGCMGDLGMHVLHLPLRFGWKPGNIRALLSKVISERPDKEDKMVPCETWDNAILACEVKQEEQNFPMTLSMKRIAPGHSNTWFINIHGTKFSAKFSTKNPKELSSLPYNPGESQAWHVEDTTHMSAYKSITGAIFEFGFSDSILQMWAAFCDELVNKENMKQSFYCATPDEAEGSHKIFSAALESNHTGRTIQIDWGN